MTESRQQPVRSAEEIRAALHQCAIEEDVHVLYACESGSRAWGFPSPDSDYDVRFIYARKLSGYLSVASDNGVIERPIEEGLDLGGWDVRKCLALLRSGNAPLLEWLVSPIVYEQDEAAMTPLEELVTEAFRVLPLVHHYLGLPRRSLESIQGGEESIHLKTYCYALRAVLAVRFVAMLRHPPPMTLAELLAAHPPEAEVRRQIDTLLERKARSVESERMPRDPVLDQFILSSFDEISAKELPRRRPMPPVEPFDAAFRETLRRVGELV